MSTFRRPVFFNTTASRIDPPDFDPVAVQTFHKTLPNYSSTRLVALPDIAKECDVKQVYLKDESDRFGLPSFKVLGASWGTFCAIATKLDLPLDTSLESLAAAAKKASITLFAATDGNHGRAVAYMAKLLSIPSYIYVPSSLSDHVRSAITDEGGILVTSTTYDEAVKEASTVADATDRAILIQDTAFSGHEATPARIVQGYSTMILEIDDQLRENGHTGSLIICPVGVGSLAQAVTSHYKSQGRLNKLVMVEPDTAACLYKSFQRGQPEKIETSHTIMSGMECGTLSSSAWPYLSAGVDASLSVSDYESHCAVEYLAKHGLSVGPCGGAGLAALRLLAQDHREQLKINKDTVVVLLNTEGAKPYRTPYDVSSDDSVVLTQVLTQIESTNPTLSAADGTGELAIANYIEAWLQHRNLKTHRLESVAGRPSVIGIVEFAEKGRRLMINGLVHLRSFTPE
jgi:diaminopropionate ammonia-lyase family